MKLTNTQIQHIIEKILNYSECNLTNDSESNEVFGMHFDIETEGASGGSCFGDQASDYRISHEEQINDLSNKIFYVLEIDDLHLADYKTDDIKMACNTISEKYIYNSTSSNNNYGGDYYGNYTNYSCIGIPFYEFFELFLNADDFLLFKNETEAITNESLYLTKIEENKKLLSVIESQISSFHTTKNKQESSLLKQIQDMKENIIVLEKQLKGFDKTKDLELQYLLNHKKQLEKFLNSSLKLKK